MLHHFETFCHQLSREVGHFDQQQWAIVIAVVIVVGIFLLRGYTPGSY